MPLYSRNRCDVMHVQASLLGANDRGSITKAPRPMISQDTLSTLSPFALACPRKQCRPTRFFMWRI